MALVTSLNDQQRDAVEVADHCSLVSCPGSGKTRTIIAKLLGCIDEVRGTPRRIGCITYTNAAVHEIERRLREEGAFDDEKYSVVGTIHSFCLRTLVRPFGHLLEDDATDRRILPPDSDLFRELVHKAIEHHGLSSGTADYFQNIGYQRDGSFLLPRGITRSAAETFFEEVGQQGFMTFSELLYIAYRTVRAQPFVAQAVSSRFSWLLVDEFQDTTELQVAILKRIVEAGRTRLFIVGDPNQSIYSFAGARPDLMPKLAEELAAQAGVTLFGNYRSSRRIVELAERICPTDPPMQAVGDHATHTSPPTYAHVADPFEAIMDYFLPALAAEQISYGETAVLASWWVPLYHLGRKLREVDVPIIGPGARPYRRSTAFARFAEEVCAYLATGDVQLAIRVQRAFFMMLIELLGYVPTEATGVRGKEILVRVLHALGDLREREQSATQWLDGASRVTADLLAAGEVLDVEQSALVVETGDAMVSQIVQNLGTKASALTVDDVGLFARPAESLRLLTIHGAKGREFDAVALIDFHEGRIPYHSARTSDELAEERRKLFVACTRARKLLMFFTDSSDHRNRPSRFLAEIGLS